MALTTSTTAPDNRQPSPAPTNLSLNLSSNNPFRNRLSFASSPSPRSADANKQYFPTMSKNPFLDPGDTTAAPRSGAANGDKTTLTADVFKDLSLLDKPGNKGPPPRSGTMPIQPRPRGPDESRSRPPPGMSSGNMSPHKNSRPRRASESSTMERPRRERDDRERLDRPRTESEERRRRERRKEREERHRKEKERIRKGGKPLKQQRGLDIIDKLDVTGVYGQGLFHHDGPFDACNPHRNVKKDRKAPMEAFPAGSANMALGGSGPLRSRIDLDKFHGRGEEGFSEFATTRKADTSIINPLERVEQVHGEESHGLGTSTFLEGAPASKKALQRRESEDQTTTQESFTAGGGLGRKKSIVQRFRGMSGSRRNAPGDMRSPEPRYHNATDGTGNSPPRIQAVSAGGPARAQTSNANEVNPFDNEYDDAFEKKGAQIRIAEQDRPSIGRATTSPKGHGLVRSLTADSSAPSQSQDDKPSGGGFLSRMKSLKGGPRRARPERRGSNN